jgi:hypothetical protein
VNEHKHVSVPRKVSHVCRQPFPYRTSMKHGLSALALSLVVRHR